MPPHTTTLPPRAAHIAPAQSRPPLPATTAAARLAEIENNHATPPARGVWVDRASWLATVDGLALELTYLEFEVLDFFVHNPGRAYSREALLYSVWGRQADGAGPRDVRTVDVLVTRLRRKLGPEHRERIETIRRVGYRYRPAGPRSHPASSR